MSSRALPTSEATTRRRRSFVGESATFRALHIERRAVQFESGGRERQAETETLRTGVEVPTPEEPGTEIRQIGGRDPGPVVAHRDDDLLLPLEIRRQGHRRPGGGVRRGVLEQVPDHL